MAEAARAPMAPSGDAPAVVAGGLVPLGSYQRPATGPSPDVGYDVARARWIRLPRDPFGMSYDRSPTWDGERLWLLSMAVEHHVAAQRGAPSRLAALEPALEPVLEPVLERGDDRPLVGRWRVVDDATPVVRAGSLLWARPGSGGVWSELVTSDRDPLDERSRCVLPPAGPSASGSVVGGGSPVTSSDGDPVEIPDCDDHRAAEVVVRVGGSLLLWGGPDQAYESGTASGPARTPPAP